jgi:DNA-directed RNA polymerase specialized sigma24 family protein
VNRAGGIDRRGVLADSRPAIVRGGVPLGLFLNRGKRVRNAFRICLRQQRSAFGGVTGVQQTEGKTALVRRKAGQSTREKPYSEAHSSARFHYYGDSYHGIPVVSQQLFERYIAAAPPHEEPEAILEQLLIEHAQPIMTRTVRSRLGSFYSAADAAELASESMLQLLGRLRSLRRDRRPADTIRFEAFATGVAANTVHRFFAQRFPERNRLRKRLRYAIETGKEFRLWQGADGATLCGLAQCSESERPAQPADVERCLVRLRDKPFAANLLGPLAREVLAALGKPIELSRLTAIAGELLGVQEPVWLAPATGESGEDLQQYGEDTAPLASVTVELRQRLERLWEEVLLLPQRHRSALLLSARATTGSALWLLVDLGVATFRGAAVALDIAVESLADIWNRLPLEDREIGKLLGLESNQVTSLRATARERLARREGRRNTRKEIGSPLPISGSNRV